MWLSSATCVTLSEILTSRWADWTFWNSRAKWNENDSVQKGRVLWEELCHGQYLYNCIASAVTLIIVCIMIRKCRWLDESSNFFADAQMHIAHLRLILYLLVQSNLLSRRRWYLHPMIARCLRCYHTLASWSRSCFDMFILGICLNVRYSADHNEMTIEWYFEENNFVLPVVLVNLRQLLALLRSYRCWSLLCYDTGLHGTTFLRIVKDSMTQDC